jgi:CubicO group peptidase (beta-lactamase class C family)
MHRVAVTLLLSAAAGCSATSAAGPAPGLPGWAGVTTLLDSAIAAGAAPGAVVGVSLAGTHTYYGTGRLGTDDPARPDSSTVYDLASLTKVIGLTTAIMLAVDEGRLVVDSPIVRYVPMFGAEPTQPERRTVTLRHLLTHSSGLPAWRALYQETSSRDDAFALADTTRLAASPGTEYTYSDLGAIVMTQAVERVMGLRIDTLLAKRVFGPLHMDDTRYLPPPSWRSRIAPTENDPWRGRVLRGEVHDENASRLDGVSGHAGLFSSARDLLKFADWLMGLKSAGAAGKCGWVGASTQSLTSTTPPAAPAPSAAPVVPWVLPLFALRQDLPPGSTRALGWDTPSATGSSAGTRFSRRSIGHTGFTGTSIWVDPERCLAVVILSNRVHPTRDNPRWGPVRGLVADRVVGALGKDFLTR